MKFKELVQLIERTHAALQKRAVAAVDRSLVVRNWLVGHWIVEFQQYGDNRAEYGAELLPRLSKKLSVGGKRGFSERSLELYRKFYLTYREISQTAPADLQLSAGQEDRISQALPAKLAAAIDSPADALPELIGTVGERLPLSWTHYTFLIQISDSDERRFYEIEAAKEGWATRELKRQFDTSLYERLALSRDKDGVRELANKGQLIKRPADAVKEPYILEFLDLDEKAKYSESDLETAIINRIEHFLLELGKGFLFQSRQFRLTFDDQHFWVDLVFYNRLLRCFVVVDLKIGNATHQDLGQMQMYVNYFDREVKSDDENPTIGILLCKTKNDAVVEMTLPEGNETIFASRYQLYLPSKDELRKQIKQIEEETA